MIVIIDQFFSLNQFDYNQQKQQQQQKLIQNFGLTTTTTQNWSVCPVTKCPKITFESKSINSDLIIIIIIDWITYTKWEWEKFQLLARFISFRFVSPLHTPLLLVSSLLCTTKKKKKKKKKKKNNKMLFSKRNINNVNNNNKNRISNHRSNSFEQID